MHPKKLNISTKCAIFVKCAWVFGEKHRTARAKGLRHFYKQHSLFCILCVSAWHSDAAARAREKVLFKPSRGAGKRAQPSLHPWRVYVKSCSYFLVHPSPFYILGRLGVKKIASFTFYFFHFGRCVCVLLTFDRVARVSLPQTPPTRFMVTFLNRVFLPGVYHFRLRGAEKGELNITVRHKTPRKSYTPGYLYTKWFN